MKLHRLVSISLALGALCSYLTAAAQWQPLHKFEGEIYAIASIYSDSVIFVGAYQGLYRSSDKGVTWTLLPATTSTVSDIRFKDDLTGWAADPKFVGPNLLRTTDAGVTWVDLATPPSIARGMYYDPNQQRLYFLNWNYPSSVSMDGGDTWTQLPFDNRNGMVFTNSHHAVISKVNGSDTVMITDDGGTTWTGSYMPRESFQPGAIPGTNTVIAIGDQSNVMNRSTDGGYTWVESRPLTCPPTTGTVLWSECGSALLVQGDIDQNPTEAGIWYSTDAGDTWANVGGPGYTVDTRFFWSGRYLYASDEENELWRLEVPRKPTITSLPEIHTCHSYNSPIHISFTNVCFGIASVLDSMDLTGSSAWSVDQPTLSHPMQPEEDFGVHYVPRPGMRDTAWLYLRFNQHGDIKDTVLTFIGEGHDPPVNVNFHAVLDKPHALAGDVVTMSVFPDRAISGLGLDTIDMGMSYDTDLLTYVSGSSLVGVVSGGTGKMPALRVVGKDLALDPAQPVVQAKFKVAIAKASSTQIALKNLAFNPDDVAYMSCTLSASADSTPFALDFLCGDSLIQQQLRAESLIGILSIVPNPAKDEIVVKLAGPGSGAETAPSTGVFDVLGVNRALVMRARGSGEYSFDVSSLEVGTYFLRVEVAGQVATKRFVVER